MTSVQQLAKHFRDVYSGANWTSVNLKDVLTDVNWQQATTKVHDLNTIATLVFHLNYYVGLTIKVLEGGPLIGSDKLSFDVPPITSEGDWQQLVSRVFSEAETCALKLEHLEDEKLFSPFADGKYGIYYRNLLGLIEHTYYHLGQISLIKKIVAAHPKTP